MNNLLKDKIFQVVKDTVEQNGYLLIDFVFRGTEKLYVIEVFIDAEKNVSAENCAELSREINTILETAGFLNSSYRLDISSPGVDRPLKFLKQYHKHMNRKFEVSFRLRDESKKITGKLLAVEGEVLRFLVNNKDEVLINFNSITKAKVLISFS